jgi:hypothetical protein
MPSHFMMEKIITLLSNMNRSPFGVYFFSFFLQFSIFLYEIDLQVGVFLKVFASNSKSSDPFLLFQLQDAEQEMKEIIKTSALLQ